MDKQLSTLVKKLRGAFGDDLTSAILYGSAVDGDRDRYSDVNVLCVLRQAGKAQLVAAAPVFHWWREQSFPAPLLMTEEEVRTSLDCFSIEFHDIKERHKVLYGADIPASLAVDYRDYRAHVERELRVKLFRLRQKGAGTLTQVAPLLQLMIDSLSTFCALMRHSLRLANQQAPVAKREVVSAATAYFGLEAAPFLSLLDLREDKSRQRGVEAATLFEQYLQQIEALVRAVDRLQA